MTLNNASLRPAAPAASPHLAAHQPRRRPAASPRPARAFHAALLLLAALLFCACGRRAPKQPPQADNRPRVFLPAIAPSSLSAGEQRDYLREHYWDKFDFADTLFTVRADSMQMAESYAQYISLISDRPTDAGPMRSLMARASVSRPMLDYFAWLAEEVLHNPNSPLRNDEFYIPVLEAQLASPYYDEYESLAPEYALNVAKQNRIGERANDIRYTLASGATGTLYNIKARYVLLFISNPGCPLCREVRESIEQSPMLREMIARAEIKMLVIYPDEDLTEWRDYSANIPSNWINGYDAGTAIRNTNSYDLHAIPALYLLDGDKRVLVKDSTDVPYIEEVIDRRS